MKSQLIAIVLACSLAGAPLSLSAEEPAANPVATEIQPADRPSDQEAWAKELREARASQSSAKTTGIITSVVGLGLLVAGNVRAQSAEEVEGCTRSGSHITCDSQGGADEANDRLDQGRGIMVGGLVVGLSGLVFLVTSSKRGEKVEELENMGRRKGYQVTLAPVGIDGVALCFSRTF